MSAVSNINLKVAIVDGDYYALQSLNGYLAWDRRTRVVLKAQHYSDLWQFYASTVDAEWPDVVILDASHSGGRRGLQRAIQTIAHYDENFASHVQARTTRVLCLAQTLDDELVTTAFDAGAHAFMLKHEVRLHIAWAIIYAMSSSFLVTKEVAERHRATGLLGDARLTVLPPRQTYPQMTDRVSQAIQLCVIEGMPAHLAADEMGISLNTIRSYIKDGYRILEVDDDRSYPVDMTPQERAFMRFTALTIDPPAPD